MELRVSKGNVTNPSVNISSMKDWSEKKKGELPILGNHTYDGGRKSGKEEHWGEGKKSNMEIPLSEESKYQDEITR